MKRVILCVLACLFAGCATFNESELTYLRSRNLPAPLMVKLERGTPLTPPDIITLARRGVPDRYVLRHLEDNGVNYLVNRAEITQMRKSGVSARVIDELIRQCEAFARRYSEPPVVVTDMWWTDSPYFASDLYYPYWW